MGFEALTGELIMANLRMICDVATAEQFIERLDLSSNLRCYLYRRFVERFPDEAASYSRRGRPERRDELVDC